MSISPIFEKVCLTDKKKTFSETVKVQTKTEILTEDVKRILNVSSFSSINSLKAQADSVTCAGKVVFFVCYESVDGQIKKCEVAQDFNASVLGEAEGCKISALTTAEKTEADVNGIKLELSVVLLVTVKAWAGLECVALTGGENLVCSINDCAIKKGLGLKKIVYPVEEEFELPYAIEEVMFHRAVPVVTSAQCGVGSIIVDGEVRLSAIVLQKQDKRVIIKETRALPFRAEIEYDQAMPALSAVARADLKTFKTDITVDNESGKSLVYASVMLTLEGEASTNDVLSLASDVFSTTDKTELERQEVSFFEPHDLRFADADVKLTVALSESEKDKSLKAVGGERVEILSKSVENDGLAITGTVAFTGYFEGENQSLFTRKMEAPFDVKLDVNIPENASLELASSVECKQISISGENAEISTRLTFTVYPESQKSYKWVKNVNSTGEKQIENCAISVYIPEKGEELWSLCKKLNQTPEQLIATNKDLSFPLTGEERIVIYRQK